MALPPTIPTSFVPHLGNAQGSARSRLESSSVFATLAYVFLGIVLLLAIGVFSYGRVLISVNESKAEELASARSAIDPATVESFVRLHNRLESSKTLLSAHPAFSGLFSSFEKITPSNTRFSTLRFSLEEGGSARIEGAGVAKNFNTLAVTSQVFSTEGKIKDAVFSNIRTTREGTVSFSFFAKIDQKDIAFKVAEISPVAPETILP